MGKTRIDSVMRILYITEIYPDVKHGVGVWGGGEKQFYEISRIMAKRGHDVTVLTCRFPGQSSEETLDGVRVVRLGLTREPQTGGARRVILPISTYILRTSREALKVSPDLVHCNTYFPVYPGKIATALQGVPLATTFHDLYGLRGWIDAQSSMIWGLLGHLATVSAAKLPQNRIIAVSPQCKQKLLRLGIRSEEITVIPNGVDLDLFDSASARSEPDQILYVGRLVHFKHVDNLITAFAEVVKEVPEAKLKIVGGGPQSATLRNLTRTLNLEEKVIFTGVTPTYEAAALYFKESAVFALPSTVEGESIAVKEAMAAGLPVVAMKVAGSGVLSLIEDGVNGFLAEPSNQPAFAHRLIELLLDNRKRKTMGAAARKFVEKYDWKTIADKVLGVYNDLN
jgi:glycosyltransferase involved in cell wall biosynthesis